MEPRSCSNLHFINAIKGGSVIKTFNVNSFSKPALVFKELNDIYEAEGFLHSAPEFNNDNVKLESQNLLLVVRYLCEVETADNEAVPCGMDGNMGGDSDDDFFDKMTLKELKKNSKEKKRKRANTQCLSPKCNQIKLEPEEDDSDLKEPLISLKLKAPKANKKCMSSCSRYPKLAVSIKPESQDLESESRLQFHVNLLSSVHVKTEVPESEINVRHWQSIISSDDDSFTVNLKDESGVADDDSFTVDHKDESGVAEVTFKGNHFEVECQILESNLCGREYQRCTFNEISYDHLEHVEVLSPCCEEIMDLNNQEKWCQQSPHLPTPEYGNERNMERSTSPVKDQSTNGRPRSCDLYEFSGQGTSDAAVQAPHTFVDDCTSREEPYHAGLPSHPQDTSSNDAELLFSKDDVSEWKQPLECISINRVNNTLNNGSHLDVMEDELSSSEERRPPISASIHDERDSISNSQSFPFGETSSSSVVVQTPERLLSTRKVVSPTSEERFCLAMNSTGSYGDMELLDSREDTYNKKENEIKSSCGESDKLDNISKSLKASVPVSRVQFISNPSQIRKKPKHERTSPPKRNMEGPRVSRSLHNVSTGCTSVQGCSENAIAFSRRQMQDIESLAMKLMSELKSMKDIVEEKLLFEAYRTLSSKHDADEVKNAITSATKAEETAKRWLSMMGRDCNRFCKIMSLTQKGDTGATSDNTVQRERKRITFADEAGGMLCHVKFFERKPNSVNQEDRAR